MKHPSKLLAILLTLAMAVGLLAAMAVPASAAFCRDCNGTGLNSLGGDCLFCNGTGDDPHTWEPCIGPGNHDHGVFSVGPVPLHHFCDVHVPKSIHYEPCNDRDGNGICSDCGQDLSPSEPCDTCGEAPCVCEAPESDKIFDWFDSWMPGWLAKAFTWITKYIFFGWLWGRWL